MSRSKLTQYVLIAFFVALSLFKFIRQDELFGSRTRGDLMPIIVAGKVWLNGNSPYDASRLHQKAFSILRTDDDTVYHTYYCLYPPSTFPLMAPVILFPYRTAMIIITILMLGLYFYALWRLSATLRSPSRFLFIAFAISCGSFHADLHMLNIGGIAISLLILAYFGAKPSSSVIAPVLAAISIAIKPQLGLLQLLGSIARKKYKFSFIAGSISLLLLIGSIAWMHFNHVNWLNDYQRMVSDHFNVAFQNNDTIIVDAKSNFGLLNLAPVVYLFTKSITMAQIVPVVLVIALLIPILISTYRRAQAGMTPERGLLLFAILSCLSLLPVYNRYYSALVLLPAFLWMWEQHGRPWLRGFLVLGVVLFTFPTPQAILDSLEQVGKLPPVIENFYVFYEPFWVQFLVGIPNHYVLILSILLTIEWLRPSRSLQSEEADAVRRPLHN